MCGEARDESFRRGIKRIAFLRYFEVTELTKDDFAGTYGGTMYG